MFICFDTKNKLEYVISRPDVCDFCDNYIGCNETDCPEYKKYDHGKQRLLYKGNIGSLFTGLYSIGTPEFAKQIHSICSLSLFSRNSVFEAWEDWVNHFDDIKQKFRKYWDVFLHTEVLRDFYDCFAGPPDSYMERSTNQELNEMLDYRTGKIFKKYNCFCEYFKKCSTDRSYHNIQKFMFADRHFLNNMNHPLADLQYTFADIKMGTIAFEERYIDEQSPTMFISMLETLYSRCAAYRETEVETCDLIYSCERLDDLARIEIHTIISQGLPVKACKNCGLPFVLTRRSDALYCDRTSPQDNTKTCKEYGARAAYQHSLQTDESMRLYRNIYMSKQMAAKRNSDIAAYLRSFEDFKRESKEWKRKVKAGVKPESEYVAWLKQVREKKVL